MPNDKMLIDATHPEETRVVVLRNGRVEEFDYESAARKLLRGNIYLAKVTRVEPALQAAFVDYGGNRHGFLAFNEIHPDYYQIPVADRQALIEEEAAAEAEEEAAADARAEAMARRRAAAEAEDAVSAEGGEPPWDDEPLTMATPENRTAEPETLAAAQSAVSDDVLSERVPEGEEPAAHEVSESDAAVGSIDGAGDLNSKGGVEEIETDGESGEAEPVEQVGNEDALEEMAVRPRRRPRSYKIHEVIKRRQVILVQVVKEERGNKGAALTTYLSLAGRYTVLMPNTGRGGGISRKITNPQDRKRLKAVAADLEVPEGMGLIIRTAGASRTKQEIKRDFEYLLRLWESVRELTLQSTAPSLVYEEGNLIKRSIRDLYNKEVDEIVVAGEEAHREARDFMRMLMPSHARNVVEYRDSEPLFTRFQIERQLNAMFSPYVTLRSGGYMVINQTEALVAIDINSGKSTREFSIEETALTTNIEAADEIARQLKLRDLAGLIVIDFIDMEEKRNNRAVERRLKEALRFDRARIQLGRISHFGLMEMSRQRLRTGVLEGSTSQCAHCQGTGVIRSTESVALAVLRGIEDALLAGAHTPLIAMTTPSVALYILNNKRPFIIDMESRHGLPITVQGNERMQGANFAIEKGAPLANAPPRRAERGAVNMDWGFDAEADENGGSEWPADAPDPEGEDGGLAERGARRRGRRRRPQRPAGLRERLDRLASEDDVSAVGDDPAGAHDDGEQPYPSAIEDAPRSGADEEAGMRRARRRGRRGGRRGRPGDGPRDAGEMRGSSDQPSDFEPSVRGGRDDWPAERPLPTYDGDQPPARDGSQAAPTPTAVRETMIADVAEGREDASAKPPTSAEPGDAAAPLDAEATKPEPPAARRRRTMPSQSTEPRLERVLVGPDQQPAAPAPDEVDETKPAKKGWWQRRFEGL